MLTLSPNQMVVITPLEDQNICDAISSCPRFTAVVVWPRTDRKAPRRLIGMHRP